MRIKFFIWITRLLLLVMFAGILPLDTVSIQAAEAQQNKKKKKKKSSSKKKKSGKKKSKKRKPSRKSSKKRKLGRKSTKKKRPTKRRHSKKRPRRPAPKKVAATPIPKKEISVVQLTNDLFDYTNQMNSSSRKLAHATRYLAGPQKKEVVRIESKEKYTTRDFEDAAAKAPYDIMTQRQLGMHYEQIHDWENAKDVYLRILSQNPLNPDAHFYLGNMYQNMGEMNKARQSYEEALALDPNHIGTLGVLAGGKNALENRTVLEKSAAQNPDGPAQKLTLIKQKLNSGEYEDAIKLAIIAQERFPKQGGFVYLQGKAYESLGEIERAKQKYQKSIKMDPHNEEAHLSLGHLYFNQEKYVYAALAFSDVVYMNNYNIDARYMQGLSYFNANEWGRAASAWEDLLHYAPQHPLVRTLLPQTYYILAVEYNRLGESSLGRTAFSKALSVNNLSRSWLPGAMRTLGKYYREKGMHKESLAAYQEVVELKPMDAQAYTGMGITYWKMNEQQLARAAWQRSLELNPDNNEAKGWLLIAHQS